MAYAAFATTYTTEPSRPSGGPQPGAIALMDWTLTNWDKADGFDNTDPVNYGIYAPRDICGNYWPRWKCTGSQHARGAAGDVGYPKDRRKWPSGHPEGTKYAAWLTRNYAILGVQEVIWAGRRWDNQRRVWRSYSGASDHFDHVHWSLNASGARYLTAGRINSVAPKPPAPPPPPPSPPLTTEDRMFFAKKKGTTEVFLFDATTYRHIKSQADLNAIALSLVGKPIDADAVIVTAGTFTNLVNGRKRIPAL